MMEEKDMSRDINHERRRFLATAATGIAAVRMAIISQA